MSPFLKTALELREQGFAVHWLQPKSKVPLHAGWAKAEIPSLRELETTYRPGYNLGFRPGKWSVVDGKEVVTLDIDIRGGEAFADAAYAAADAVMEGQFRPQVRSGSGWGRHQHLLVPIGQSPKKSATTLVQSSEWVKDGKVFPERVPGGKPAYVVELLSTGKNVVLPPSIHPDTQALYAWIE